MGIVINSLALCRTKVATAENHCDCSHQPCATYDLSNEFVVWNETCEHKRNSQNIGSASKALSDFAAFARWR